MLFPCKYPSLPNHIQSTLITALSKAKLVVLFFFVPTTDNHSTHF